MTFKIKHDSDDNTLWSEFLSGNEEAYSIIYQKYAHKMFQQGIMLVADREIVWDCIHDVFVKIYTSRKKLKPVQNLRVYLFVSLRNTIYTLLHKNQHTSSYLPEHAEEAVEIPMEEKIIRIEEENTRRTLLSEVFSKLTDRQKEIIHYRFIQSLNVDEIGVLMQMNTQSVYNLLHRAIKKIKHHLKKN